MDQVASPTRTRASNAEIKEDSAIDNDDAAHRFNDRRHSSIIPGDQLANTNNNSNMRNSFGNVGGRSAPGFSFDPEFVCLIVRILLAIACFA
jgi:hypothetical protein